MHDPPLDEFALLSGIAAVDNAFGLFHEAFDDVELFFDTFVLF